MKRFVLRLLLLVIVAGVGWVSTQLTRGRSLGETLVSAVTTSEDVALSVKARTSLTLSERIAGLEVRGGGQGPAEGRSPCGSASSRHLRRKGAGLR
jgi:hypothetical protein